MGTFLTEVLQSFFDLPRILRLKNFFLWQFPDYFTTRIPCPNLPHSPHHYTSSNWRLHKFCGGYPLSANIRFHADLGFEIYVFLQSLDSADNGLVIRVLTLFCLSVERTDNIFFLFFLKIQFTLKTCFFPVSVDFWIYFFSEILIYSIGLNIHIFVKIFNCRVCTHVKLQ